MEHVVYLEAKEKELDKLASGEKQMIVRGAAGRKLPYGRVVCGEVLWFIENKGDGMVRGKAVVKRVFNSEKLSASEALQLIEENQLMLRLSPAQIKRWAGKRYLVLMELQNFELIPPFAIDRSDFGNMDDWLPVKTIEQVKVLSLEKTVT
ncbi:MAG: hypothetical protein GX836_10535 [Spirochaetales bacterium]|nr:hypothetical protein [Spirochaetales bacterium]